MIYNVRQVAEHYDVWPVTVHRWVASGQLPAIEGSKPLAFEEADVLAVVRKPRGVMPGLLHGPKVPPSFYVKRWRQAHRETDRALDRQYKRLKRNRTFQSAWPLIVKRYGPFCPACVGTDRETDKLCVDHVIPLGKPGSNHIANLQPLCRSCNSAKQGTAKDYRLDGGQWIIALLEKNGWNGDLNLSNRRYGKRRQVVSLADTDQTLLNA